MCGRTRETRCVDDVRANREACVQLIAPLFTQSGGRDDEDAGVVLPGEQLRNHQTGLDGLAKSHFVRKQEAASGASHHGDRGLELEWQQRDVRARGGTQRSP